MIQDAMTLARAALRREKIHQLPPRRERHPSPNPDFVIMAMESFALAVIVKKPVSGGEAALDPYLVHEENHIP